MTLTRAGLFVFVVAMIGLGGLEAVRGEPLPGLHQFPEAMPTWAVRVCGGLLAVAAFGVAMYRPAALLLGALWLSMFVFAFRAALGAGDTLAWVPVAETAVFAAFAFWRWDDGRGWRLLRILFGAMLILFGAIHLAQRDMIALLIPTWIPAAEHWPWLTGGVSVLAGSACVIGRGVQASALAIALMYASWLPLVHAGRLAETPNMFEWTFALTALALAGVALAIAGRSAAAPDAAAQGGLSQSSS